MFPAFLPGSAMPRVLVSIVALWCVPWAALAAGPVLNVLTWADYIDPEVVAEFEQATGATVKFTFFESDDARDQVFAASGGEGVDVACVNGLRIEGYVRRGWLAAVSRERIPSLRHLDPRWTGAFPDAAEYGVPYFWGTLGIGYRKDLVPAGFRSWMDLLRPREALRGHIAMMRSSRDMVGMALKALGHSASSGDRADIEAAEALLTAQRPFVKSYTYVSLDENSALVTGEVWASMMYSGDALMVQEHDPNIVYVVPEEGGNLWVDYLVVSRRAARPALAERFLEFLNVPEVAARNAEFVYYATPNRAAEAHVSREYLDNPVIYPGKEVLARSEFYTALPPRAQKRLNAAYARVVH